MCSSDLEEKSWSLTTALQTYSGTKWKAFALIPYLKSLSDSDLQTLKKFMEDNFNDFLVSGNKAQKQYSTYFKKLICFYDWKKYGW